MDDETAVTSNASPRGDDAGIDLIEEFDPEPKEERAWAESMK